MPHLLRTAMELVHEDGEIERIYAYNSVTINRTINSVSSLSFSVPNPKGIYTDKFDFTDSIIFYAGYDTLDLVKMFEGQIYSRSIGISKDGSMIQIECLDKSAIMERELCANESVVAYPDITGTNATVIAYLVGKLSEHIDIEIKTSTTDVSGEFSFDSSKTVLDAVKQHAEWGGYEFYYNSNADKMVFREPMDRNEQNVVMSFIIGNKADYNDIPNTDDVSWMFSSNLDESRSEIYNRVRYEGSGSLAVVEQDDESIKDYGLRVSPVKKDEKINNIFSLRQIAKNFLNDMKYPRKSGSLSTYGQHLNPGDIIYVNDKQYGYSLQTSKFLKISAISHKFDTGGWFTDLTLDDFSPSLIDFL